MIEEIIDFILKIPAMIEFIIGAVVYLIIENTLGQVLSEVAKDTICKTSGFSNWILCFYLTNKLMAFLLTVASVIVIGTIFRNKFFNE